MIPKILHYTWFSNDAFPSLINDCIKSWKKLLPDYEFILWDKKSIEKINSIFLKEAIAEQKWAYASDFVRLYAVYNEGGIYLDTDMELIRPLNFTLEGRAFIGIENSIHYNGEYCHYLTSHCFGAEKGHPFIKQCLDYYRDRHFITSNNMNLPFEFRYNYVLLPYIQATFARKIGYNWRLTSDRLQQCENGLTIYPSVYFDGFLYERGTVAKHWALGSWRENQEILYDERLFNSFARWKKKNNKLIQKWLLRNHLLVSFIR